MNQLPFNHYSPDRMILWTLLLSALLHALAGYGVLRNPVTLSQATQPAIISVELRTTPGTLTLPPAVQKRATEVHRAVKPVIRVRNNAAPRMPAVRATPLRAEAPPSNKPIPLSPTSTVAQGTKPDMASPALPGTFSGEQREYGKNTASVATVAAGGDATAPRGVASASQRGGETVRPSQPSTAYYARIRERLEHNKEYPHLARRARMEGSVTVQFQIRGNGSPDALRVTKSSGYGVLDESALRTVRNSAPFPLPPDHQGAKDLLISVPLVFRLER